MGPRGQVAIAGTAIAAFLALAACGSSTGSAGPGGSLREGMAAVQDSPVSRTFFAWSDQHALRQLTGITSYRNTGDVKKVNPTWARLAGEGLAGVAGLEPQLTSSTGIDVHQGSRAITVGVPPEAAGRLDGADTGAVQKKMKALGAPLAAVQKGRSLAVLAPDDQVDRANPHLGGDVYLALNRVAVKGSTVGFSLAGGPLDVVLGGGRTLVDDPDEAAMAECLGDVIVARVTSPPPGAAAGVTLVGVGVRRPSSPTDRPREVLCEVAGNAVDGLAAGMVARTQPSAPLPGSGLHVQDRLAQATVDQLRKGSVRAARLTADLVTPARAGFLLFDLGSDSAGLAYIGGGTTPPRS